jgi:hypothetical protein
VSDLPNWDVPPVAKPKPKTWYWLAIVALVGGVWWAAHQPAPQAGATAVHQAVVCPAAGTTNSSGGFAECQPVTYH